MSASDALLLDIAGPCESTASGALAPLLAALQERYGASLQAVVFYGSCLRTGNVHEGLVDFYAIVDSYRRAHHHTASALANALVPPNVYYVERDSADGPLRAKVAVLSMAQLERGAARWFQSGVWGRFAQPVALVYARSPESAQRVRAACGQAVVSLLQRALPVLAEKQAPADAFAGALAQSYACELRVESSDRSGELVASAAAEYRRRLLAARPTLPYASHISDNGDVCFDIPAPRRRRARLAWAARRAQGKALSVARLVKASVTFRDAIDYAAWKLERHTGVAIDVTPRLRRYPLVFGWGVLWRLYRRGALR